MPTDIATPSPDTPRHSPIHPAALARQLHLHEIAPPAILVLGLIVAWWLGSATGAIPKFIAPAPQVLAMEFLTNHAVLIKHARATLTEALSGFVIGNVCAVVMAVIFVTSQRMLDAFYPFALLSRGIPIAVLTPIFVIFLGRGFPAIITMVAVSVYFPTFLNTLRGLNTVDRDCEELLHTLSASPRQKLKLVQIPAALPYFFAALKISASVTFIAALVGEWIGSNEGLGYLVLTSGQYFRLATMWASILTSAALTLMLLGLITLAEKALGRWTAIPADL